MQQLIDAALGRRVASLLAGMRTQCSVQAVGDGQIVRVRIPLHGHRKRSVVSMLFTSCGTGLK